MTEKDEYPRINQAAYAVADAMMVAQYNLTYPLLEEFARTPQPLLSVDDREKRLALATAGECMAASLNVIYELFRNHSELFEFFLVLHGYRTMKYDYHEIFFVQSREGEWFAGSPANSGAGWSTELFRGHSVQEVMLQLKEHDNCTWPKSESIESALPGYLAPIILQDDTKIIMGVTAVIADQQTGDRTRFRQSNLPVAYSSQPSYALPVCAR